MWWRINPLSNPIKGTVFYGTGNLKMEVRGYVTKLDDDDWLWCTSWGKGRETSEARARQRVIDTDPQLFPGDTVYDWDNDEMMVVGDA